MKNKIASTCVFSVCFIGFVPLLVVSILSGRDIQLELANTCINLWKKD